MGSGYNLPDGCYESDLPGYWEVDDTVTVDCPECGREFTTDVCYDSKRDKTYDVTCDKTDGGCGYEWEELTPKEAHRQEMAWERAEEMRENRDRGWW